MHTRTTFIACALALLVAVGGAAGTVQPSLAQASEATTITECAVVTEPGTYVLGNDVGPGDGDGPCLEIVADDVTLDGDGYAVDGGVGLGDTAEVDRTEVQGVVVRNLATTEVQTTRSVADVVLDSIDVEEGMSGLFFSNVTVTDSRFGGQGVTMNEDSGDVVVANSTFDGERGVTFFEYVQDARVTDNEFVTSGWAVFVGSTGSDTTDVLVADNRIDAGGGDGISTTEGGRDIEVRDNEITNASVGIDFLTDGRIVGNDVHDSGVGISVAAPVPLSGDLVVETNTITDNRIGVAAGYVDGGDMRLHGNLIAGNTEFGVRVSESGDAVLDARNNSWGDPSGPSSGPADPDAPFADPVTGALANGSGDAVSEGSETPGVSNVRFDPVTGADGPDPEPTPEPTPEPEPEPTPEPEPVTAFYQVDLVTGPVIEQFGPADSEAFYSDQGRLVGYLHGSDGSVDRTGTPPTLDGHTAACVVVDSYDVSGDTVTVQFTVTEDCDLDLTLVSYEKPGDGWSRASASDQRLVAAESGTFGPGTHELTVSLPTSEA